jgi:hypothetical protein
LKPLGEGEVPPPVPVTPPLAPPTAPLTAENAERRRAEAIAFVQSESFRRETRQQDAEMAGDLKVLAKKPYVLRTVIGILVLVSFAVLRGYLRSERINRHATRLETTETAPAPSYPQTLPPPGVAAQPQPRYVAQPAPIYNPAFDQRLSHSRYAPPGNAPGMRRAPIQDLPPGVPDPLADLRRQGIYPPPSGNVDERFRPGEQDRRMLEEALRQQQASQQQQTQQSEPSAANPQTAPPPAFPQNPSAPVSPQQQQQPVYPQQPTTPTEQTPSNLPPSDGNGGYVPPPR